MDPILEALAHSVSIVMTFQHLGMLLVGIAIGLTVGVLPGLGGTVGLSLILPFAYGMDPTYALAMMVGLLAPVHTSDTIPAIMMGIPGTASAQASVMDGYPLARKGEAARALSAAFTASMVGGLIGAAILTVAIFLAKPIILAMGFGELLMLTILALSTVGIVTGTSVWKGLAACVVGLLIGSIGPADATGEFRATFGSLYLHEGVPLVVVALGLFAVPEIVDLLRRGEAIAQTGELKGGWWQGISDVIANKWLVLRSSVMGVFLGALPGLGGSVADWIVYGQTVQLARNKEEFGKGDIRGLIAPESANNSITGGALIPTLLFGIPGSGSMAILLGGFVLIGIQPGPSMVTSELHLSFVIIWSLALANLIGAGACFLFAKQMARLTMLNFGLIGPVMIAIVFFAAFQSTRLWHDLIALVVIGTLGVGMKRFGWSRPALVIGFVLSHGVESSFYRVAQLYGFSFLERPIVIGLLILTLLSVGIALTMKSLHARELGDAPDLRARLPQIIFTGAIIAFVAAITIDALGLTRLAQIFPLWTSILGFAFLIPTLLIQIFSKRDRAEINDEEIAEGDRWGSLVLGLLWMGSYLLCVALVGIAVGGAIFVFAFTTWAVGAPIWRNLLIAVGTGGVIYALGEVLHLNYPANVARMLLGS